MHFVSLFFLNERNITISLFMIHLKFTVAHFANLKSSFINKPYLRAVECAISFLFRFLICCYFNEAFAKNLMKKLSFFKTNLQNSFQDVLSWTKYWDTFHVLPQFLFITSKTEPDCNHQKVDV